MNADLYGQATLGAGTAGGTVRDETGLPVPAAAVSLIDNERGARREITSNDVGAFLFPNVPPGSYSIEVKKEGFQAKRITNIQLQVGEVATVDVSLPVGSISTVVSVTGAQATLIETESNVIGTVIDSARVEELPLNGRDFLQLAFITAGTSTPTGGSDVYSSQVGHPNRSVIIAGNVPSTTGYTVNGIATRGARLGESALNLSVAAIDQFKVQESFFLPDQGPDPALVNVTTKSGSNAYHGQLFEFLRNKDLDARSYFAPAPENLKRNQFGGALGGRIKKDKAWFYGYFEGLRQVSAFSSNAFTPTAAMFQGNFQGANTIYDPATYSADTGTRSPFPNNTIPANRINPVAANLLKYYLAGSSLQQRPSNLFVNPHNLNNDEQWGVRTDFAPTQNQNLFVQVMREDGWVINQGALPLTGVSYPNTSTLAMIQHTWTVSPTLINTARAGFTRNFALDESEQGGNNLLGSLGINNALDPTGVSAISLTGYTSFGRAAGTLGNIDNNYQVDDGLIWVRGAHSLQFGGSIKYHRTWQENANANARGSFAFQPQFTAQLARNAQGAISTVANTGDAFADFLLGLPFNSSLAGLPMFQYRFTQYMPYVQDTWRVSKNLTVNLGLAWFLSTVPDPQGQARNYVHSFNPQTGLLTYAALGQIDPKILPLDRNNFAPRLGLAWQPSFLAHTVFRAGIGTYYNDTALSEAQFGMVAPPFNTPLQLFNTQPSPTYVLGQNLFPALSFPTLSENFAAQLPAGATPFWLKGPGRTPYVNQWNASLERSVGSNDVVEIDYLGSSAHRLQNRYDTDQCRPNESLFCSAATKPYPQYAGLLTADFNGNSSYQAMLVKFNHRAGGGLNFRLEYTLAKSLTDTFEGPAVATSSQIAACRACDKGYTSFDVRHRVVLNSIYNLPFGRGRSFGSNMPKAADVFVGGWTVTSIATFSTGVPLFITSPNTNSSVYISQRPNRVCDGANPDLAGNLRNNGLLYFDTSCFVTPPTGYFGNSGRTPLHGPGINNWDIGIGKHFGLPGWDISRLEFRAEMFNAFNHARFQNPNVGTGAGANFGRISSTGSPRLVQLALKLVW